MKILLLGSGAREHALGWRLAKSSRVDQLVSLPGNPGLASLGPTIGGVDASDGDRVAASARAWGVDLVVVGPEAPLAAGVVDHLRSGRIPVWGPSRAAARLEWSKSFAKHVMDRAGVATADWGTFTDEGRAISYLDGRTGPFVVKADGLAAGKGVLVTDHRAAAEEWVHRCLSGWFGEKVVIIEDFLDGPEVSLFALCAGSDVLPLEPARDYKRLLDGDAGPNTGGMGAFSPLSDLPAGLVGHTVEKVMRPVLTTLSGDGFPYTGFLYVGLVLTEAGPRVLEFNCRLGDPETQAVLPRLETDLVDLIEAGLEGTLARQTIEWSEEAVVSVVLASAGYPDRPLVGETISIPEMGEGELVFHAATSNQGGQLFTGGGRVLSAVGLGPDLAQARSRAYSLADRITFAGKQLRRDIASAPGLEQETISVSRR
ncbi:MAG: phosphoribosylamine--glycine ligase [Actinomycetota bacterium]